MDEFKNNPYIGRGKQKKQGNGTLAIKGAICLEDFLEASKGVEKSKNGKTYIPIYVKPHSGNIPPDRYGNTHAITTDFDDKIWNPVKEVKEDVWTESVPAEVKNEEHGEVKANDWIPNPLAEEAENGEK